jgi:transposase
MDNAHIHHGVEILELLDRFGMLDVLATWTFTDHLAGVRVEYLPPYSPDLNSIEEAFSKIKHFLRRHQNYYGATTGDGILFDMLEIHYHHRGCFWIFYTCRLFLGFTVDK